MKERKEKRANQSSLCLSLSFLSLSLIAFLSVAKTQQHFWVWFVWLLPVLRLFAEEDYDHDLFGHIGSHLGLYHWRILWIVIIF